MMLPKFTDGTETIMYMADLIPRAAHIPLPWIMGYDLNTIFTNTGSFAFDADGKLLDPFFSSIVGPTSERDKLIYSFSIQNLFQTKSVSNNNSLDNTMIVCANHHREMPFWGSNGQGGRKYGYVNNLTHG